MCVRTPCILFWFHCVPAHEVGIWSTRPLPWMPSSFSLYISLSVCLLRNVCGIYIYMTGARVFPPGSFFCGLLWITRDRSLYVYIRIHTHPHILYSGPAVGEGWLSVFITNHIYTDFVLYICYIIYIAAAARHIRSNIYSTSSYLTAHTTAVYLFST